MQAQFAPQEHDITEALRYAGVRPPAPPALQAEMRALAAHLAATCPPRYTYRVFALQHTAAGFALPGAGLVLAGTTAATMLAGCSGAVLLACTLGAEFDALLRRTEKQDMARAVLLDGCGGAFVEAGCDAAEAEIRARLPGKYLTDRFSPGYGDLPLSLQPALCTALDAYRRLGVTVSESLLLNPIKTVTAVLGVADAPQPARVRGCAHCALRQTCTFRKRGTTCEL